MMYFAAQQKGNSGPAVPSMDAVIQKEATATLVGCATTVAIAAAMNRGFDPVLVPTYAGVAALSGLVSDLVAPRLNKLIGKQSNATCIATRVTAATLTAYAIFAINGNYSLVNALVVGGGVTAGEVAYDMLIARHQK